MIVDARETFVERLIEDATRSLEAFSVHLGLTLGLYRTVADLGPATGAEVAAAARIADRYARKWLEQQATAGYLICDDPSAAADDRRYRLPDAHAEVLLDPDSDFHVGPVATMLTGVARVLPQLEDAYRSGGGVAFAAYGTEFMRGISDLNRPLFRHGLLGWLTAVPDIDQRLRSAPARVLDLGCGRGQSCIALADAYPTATVLGIDLDEASIREAKMAADQAGVADRVTFIAGDAASVAVDGAYELVTLFETLHDMGDPVGSLRTARSVLVDGGAVLIGDDKVADEFTAPGDLLERFQFGWSVLHCLPATMAENPVEANGTMLRPSTVARWAREAGFTRFELPPIDSDFWRFYVLRA